MPATAPFKPPWQFKWKYILEDAQIYRQPQNVWDNAGNWDDFQFHYSKKGQPRTESSPPLTPPRTEPPRPLWATFSSVWSLSEKNKKKPKKNSINNKSFFFCLNTNSCIANCAHCLLSLETTEESLPLSFFLLSPIPRYWYGILWAFFSPGQNSSSSFSISLNMFQFLNSSQCHISVQL